MDMRFQETIWFRGKAQQLDAIQVNGVTFLLRRRGTLRVAAPRNTWHDLVSDPVAVLDALSLVRPRVDLLTFWQKPPDFEPHFSYFSEARIIAAIPISTYEQWWKTQLVQNARNKIRKAIKAGVEFREVELTDNFIRGVVNIFNHSKVRRGKPFWHYGKDFATVKREMSLREDEAVFIGAYYREELIGFMKILLEGPYARSTLILDNMNHRDKAPINGMIAKVVEICAERKLPYFLYSIWRRGDHGHFQRSNGFEKVAIPEYYVPITWKGRMALRVGLHRELKSRIPERFTVMGLELRRRWYLSRAK
jgi:hypothetical protein